MSKFEGWESQLDSKGQPILPKQVVCITNKFKDIDPKLEHLGEIVFEVGEVYDVLPYPYNLNSFEAKAASKKSGLLFMKDPRSKNGMNFYISKRYFEPIEE